MFRIIAGIVFILLIWWLIWTLRNFNLKDFTSSLKQTPANILLSIKKLIYVILVICTLILLFTGLLQPLIFGKPISGFLLMLHVTIAPLFAIIVAICSVLWAQIHSFSSIDWQKLQKIKTYQSEGKKNFWTSESFQKILFWIGILLSLPIILTIILSMYRTFGTHGQEILLQIHRYCAMMFVIVVFYYTSINILHLRKSNN